MRLLRASFAGLVLLTAAAAMRDVPAAPHDPARLDRAAMATWMREKIAMQRDFAKLLERHAADSEAALREIEQKP